LCLGNANIYKIKNFLGLYPIRACRKEVISPLFQGGVPGALPGWRTLYKYKNPWKTGVDVESTKTVPI
jgi:hypothetical protein